MKKDSKQNPFPEYGAIPSPEAEHTDEDTLKLPRPGEPDITEEATVELPTASSSPEELPLEEQPTVEMANASTSEPLEDQPTAHLETAHLEHEVVADESQSREASLSIKGSTPSKTPNEQSLKPAPPSKRRKKKFIPWKVALVILGIFLLLSGGTVGALYYYYQTNIHEDVQQFIKPVDRDPTETTGPNMPSSKDISNRAWNILLLGSDNDNKYTFPQVLTQVMMVVRVDPINNKVTMVSIPRDSWVPIPGMGYHKVSQAFYHGASNGNSFENAVRLARKTVEQDYGIPIDRYAWIGLDGFAKLIDVLGGVDVDVTHPMVDDAYPHDVGKGADPNNPHAYKRLYLLPGPQHLSGEQALEYVRTRHGDLNGDFGRTVRQQQVLTALKGKLDIQTILSNIKPILQSMQGSLYTDLDEGEMLGFANFGRNLNNDAIEKLTLGPDGNFGQPSTVYDPSVGATQYVVIPSCSTIQPVINRIFALGEGTRSCKIGS